MYLVEMNEIAGEFVMTQNVDGCASTGLSDTLPRPYRINGRFVIPWPGFKQPGAGGVVKFLASFNDESNIPPRKVPVTFVTCSHLLASQWLMLIITRVSAVADRSAQR